MANGEVVSYIQDILEEVLDAIRHGDWENDREDLLRVIERRLEEAEYITAAIA